jgi:hypothetical protein
MIVGLLLKAHCQQKQSRRERRRKSRKCRQGSFRLLTDRVEGTLHPAGILIARTSGDRAIPAISATS